jgi:hypothetical protein
VGGQVVSCARLLSTDAPRRRFFSFCLAFLTDTWGYKVLSIAGALKRWATKTERDPKRTYVWICALCLNQHRIVQTMTPDELSAEFGARVSAIGHLLPMLEPWRDPQNLKRAWCLFELFTAIGEGGKVAIDVVLTEEEDESFLNAMSTEGYACIDAALASIRSENATATVEADLKAIRELIKSKPGGFETLDTTVRNHLHEWFEDRGAVKSARRLDRSGRKNSTGTVMSASAAASSAGAPQMKPGGGYLQPLALNPGYTPNVPVRGEGGGGDVSDTHFGFDANGYVLDNIAQGDHRGSSSDTAAGSITSPRHEYAQINNDDDGDTKEDLGGFGEGGDGSSRKHSHVSAAGAKHEYARIAENDANGEWGFGTAEYLAI